MYFNDYYDDMALLERKEQVVWEQLEEQRQEAINAIGTLVRQDQAECFAKILAAAMMIESPEAETIAKKIGLNQTDFLAIEQNYPEYRQCLIQKGWNV